MVTSRRPPERTRVRRTELLEQLRTEFLSKGFLGQSVADLAAELHCSKSTLYLVARSKEQIVLETVNFFFTSAAERIEIKVAERTAPADRLACYLMSVADELHPAAPRFMEDLAAFEPAAAVYRRHTRAAARRVHELVDEGVAAGDLRPVNAAFVGAAVATVMTAIQNGEIENATGLADAEAYRNLADLVLTGLSTAVRPATAHASGRRRRVRTATAGTR